MTQQAEKIDLPPISEEDRAFLHYNPNTQDLVDWVQAYARKAIAHSSRWRRFGEEKPPIGEKVLISLRERGFADSTREAKFDGKVWDLDSWHRGIPCKDSDLWLPMPKPREGK